MRESLRACAVAAAPPHLFIRRPATQFFNRDVRRVNLSSAAVSTLAGTGTQGVADGPGSTATFYGAWALAHWNGGGGSPPLLYVADAFAHNIRAISLPGAAVTTVAGGGSSGGTSSGYVNDVGTAAKSK